MTDLTLEISAEHWNRKMSELEELKRENEKLNAIIIVSESATGVMHQATRIAELEAEVERLRESLEMIQKAAGAQAEDDSLWATNIPGQPFTVGIGEAYIQQSLRWLHAVIEDRCHRALAGIVEQSADHKLATLSQDSKAAEGES